MPTTEGLIQHLQDTIDASRSRVVGLPHRIWLFGGGFAEKTSEPPVSLRDSFNRECRQRPYSWASDISCPEEYPDWLEFSGYEDLLLFERDAGFLSRVIVIFVESAGAFAELGAFALDEQLHRKLFVVIPRKHREHARRRSFLNLGPLKRIEGSKPTANGTSSNICVIDSDRVADFNGVELDLIFESLDAWLTQGHASERFRNDNPTHRLLLIADLVDLLQVVSEKNTIEAAKLFGLEIDRADIRKCAQLLDMLGLIRFSERGNEKFLVTLKAKGSPLVEYDAKPGRRFERLSFKTKAWQLVKADPRLSPLLTSA